MTRDIINPEQQPVYGPHRAFGEQLHYARAQMQLTLRSVARICGVSPTQWSMFEQGHVMPGTLDIFPLLEYASQEIVAANQTIKEMENQEQNP